MMKVIPTGAISRLSLRIGERRQKKSDGRSSGLTSLDEENLKDFEALIIAGIKLLDLENDALNTGDTARVAECYDRKLELLNELGQKQPLVEPFLRGEGEQASTIREKTRDLAQKLAENGRILEGMSQASRTVQNEIERLRKRQSLDGMYDKTGQLIRGLNKISGKITKNI